MARIHMVVPTTTKFDFLGIMAPFARPGVTFTQSHLDQGPESVESEFDEMFAGPDTIIKAMEAERSGADAIVVICMRDPALPQLREALTIPVFGPGETAMHYATMLGHKFSILTTVNRPAYSWEHRARINGLEEKLASVRPTGVPVLDIETNPQTQNILITKALQAVEEDGADVIILGCGCFKNLDRILEQALQQRGYNVPVIDAIPLTVLTAATVVQCGLRHSKKAYPFPPSKTHTGFNIPK